MKQKKQYQSPAVIKKVEMELEQSILSGSVVEQRLQIETAGHEVVDHDFDDTGFNSDWK